MLRNRKGGLKGLSPFKSDGVKADMPAVKVTPQMQKTREFKKYMKEGAKKVLYKGFMGGSEGVSEKIKKSFGGAKLMGGKKKK